MFTYLFWRLAAERAVKTFAQTLAALFSANGIGLLSAPWGVALSAAGMAALLSVLTSVASEPAGERSNPSLVRSDKLAAAPVVPTPVAAPVVEPVVVSADVPMAQAEPRTAVSA